MSAVETAGLSKSYPTPDGPLTILDGVTVAVDSGEAVAVTGPSGCGKSTLLSILGLLEEPTGGTVRLFGEEPFKDGESERARFRNGRIGFVFQDHHLLPQCTVLENVLVPLLATRSTTTADESTAKGLLGSVGLSHRLTHRPGRLSGGERQRVAICRALVNTPDLVLADEPTGNLDPETAGHVGDLLLRLGAEQGTTLLCVTHSEELAGRFPRRLRLDRGRLVEAEAAAGA